MVFDSACTCLIFRTGSLEFKKPVPKFQSESLGGGGLGDAVAPMPGVIEKVRIKAYISAHAGVAGCHELAGPPIEQSTFTVKFKQFFF